MQAGQIDRRLAVAQSRSDAAARYFRESGILALILDLQSKGFTQDDIADYLTQHGHENSAGCCSWTQAAVSKILTRARKRGDIPAAVAE